MAETGWLDVVARLGPAATGAAALVALVVGLATVRQRGRADARDQWWKRAHWALDLTLSADYRHEAHGWAVLMHLSRSALAAEDERRFLAALTESGLNPAGDASDNGSAAPAGAPGHDREVADELGRPDTR